MPHNIHRYRRILLFLAASLLLLASTAVAADYPSPRGAVNDFAGMMSADMRNRTEALSRELLDKTGAALVVVTVDNMGGESVEEYANKLYQQWGIGKKGEDRGVLLLVSKEDRRLRIEVGYGLEGVIPDGLAGQVRDQHMLPYFKQGRFGEGLYAASLALSSIIANHQGVQLDGVPRNAPAVRTVKRSSSPWGLLPMLLFVVIFLMAARRRGGLGALLLLSLLGGGGGHRGGGFGGGGFSGGFGGFGGGMSGGGGASGSW